MTRIFLGAVVAAILGGLIVGDPIEPDQFEPDDDFANATPIELNARQRAHNIHFETFDDIYDVDFVELTLDAPAAVLLDTPKGFGYREVVRRMPISLYDADENPIGTDAPIRVVDLSAGTYYISVTSANVFNESAIVPYYTILARDASLPDRFEGNDTQEAATYIAYGGDSQAHNFDNDTDVDWFTFTVGEFGSPPTSVITQDINGDLFPSVTYFADTGDGLQEITPQNDFNNGVRQYIANDAQTYYLRVENPQTGRAPEDTYYSITVGGTFYTLGTSPPGTVIGIITSGPDEIVDASVQVNGPLIASTVSDDDGVYAFPALVSGSYELLCEKDGYESAMATISIERGKLRFQSFELTPNVPTDINGDLTVNAQDIQAMINAVLGTGPNADANNDGIANSIDIQLVILDVLGLS